jgi:hypothetical protein
MRVLSLGIKHNQYVYDIHEGDAGWPEPPRVKVITDSFYFAAKIRLPFDKLRANGF